MFTRIDRTDKGVVGLPDTPNLSTTEMQEKLDELGAMAVDGANHLMDELENNGAANIGMLPPPGYDGEENVQAILDDTAAKAGQSAAMAHTHANKSILDTITQIFIDTLQRLVTLFVNITSISTSVTDSNNAIPTSHAIVNYVSRMGGGDMMKATYDSNEDGKIDNAEHADTADTATTAERATSAENADTVNSISISNVGEDFFLTKESLTKKVATGDLIVTTTEDPGEGAPMTSQILLVYTV